MTAVTARRSWFPGLWRWCKPLLLAAIAVATIAVLALNVFPTRTWLDQRAELRQVSAEVADLQATRAELEARVVELDSDEQIEAIARSQYGLVKPGEEAYAVLPAPPVPIELPEIWPYGVVFDAADDAPSITPLDVPSATVGSQPPSR